MVPVYSFFLPLEHTPGSDTPPHLFSMHASQTRLTSARPVKRLAPCSNLTSLRTRLYRTTAALDCGLETGLLILPRHPLQPSLRSYGNIHFLYIVYWPQRFTSPQASLHTVILHPFERMFFAPPQPNKGNATGLAITDSHSSTLWHCCSSSGRCKVKATVAV